MLFLIDVVLISRNQHRICCKLVKKMGALLLLKRTVAIWNGREAS